MEHENNQYRQQRAQTLTLAPSQQNRGAYRLLIGWFIVFMILCKTQDLFVAISNIFTIIIISILTMLVVVI